MYYLKFLVELAQVFWWLFHVILTIIAVERCEVGIQELTKDSPLGRLRGSDNVVSPQNFVSYFWLSNKDGMLLLSDTSYYMSGKYNIDLTCNSLITIHVLYYSFHGWDITQKQRLYETYMPNFSLGDMRETILDRQQK